jgi:hypothetical protein
MSVLKPTKIYVSEIRDEMDHMCHHIVIHDGYRQVVSAGAFFHGVKKHDKDKKRGIIWASHYEHEHYLYTKKTTDGFSIWPDDVEIVEHKSIWAFYKYIGYDYKKKKWTTSP